MKEGMDMSCLLSLEYEQVPLHKTSSACVNFGQRHRTFTKVSAGELLLMLLLLMLVVHSTLASSVILLLPADTPLRVLAKY